MSGFLASKYAALDEYVPGEQPRDKKYIKLNTNESPYPPSEEVVRALGRESILDLRLYPDPDCTELCDALAKRYGVKSENIFLSNGSDDILNFAFMAFCERGAMFPDITYGFYKVFAELHGVDAKIVPLRDDFAIDLRDYRDSDRTFFIANPNAPTGLALSPDEIEDLLRENPGRVVVVDEAYVDFGAQSCVGLTKKYDNLLVCATFSKSRCMAGARLGFAIASRGLIGDLQKIKYCTNPYNVNRLTQVAGTAAILSDGYYMQKASEIADTREFTKRELRALGFDVTDSRANFVFAKKDGASGRELYLGLKEKGILVRRFDTPRISEYLRITIGTREQMGELIRALGEICGK